MKPSEFLALARNTVADPEKWTIRFAGRTKAGNPTASTSPEAVCWCSVGILNRKITDLGIAKDVDGLLSSEVGQGALRHLALAMGWEYQHQTVMPWESLTPDGKAAAYYNWIASVNDRSTHAQVLEFFNNAVLSARKEEDAHQN